MKTEPELRIGTTQEVKIPDIGEFVTSRKPGEKNLRSVEELVTIISKGNVIEVITPQVRYTINLSLEDRGIMGKIGGIRRVNNYSEEVCRANREAERKGYGVDAGDWRLK